MEQNNPNGQSQVRIACVSCGKLFARTPKDFKKLADKKIPLPMRCTQCRKLNIIEDKLKFIIKLLTQGKPQPVKVTTEVTRIKIQKNGKQKLSKEQKQRVSNQA